MFRRPQIRFRSESLKQRKGFELVTCTGEYRDGCAGNSDAQSIIDYCIRVIEKSRCDGIVLDYRTLTYRWGDMIEATLDIASHAPDSKIRYVPTVFIVGEKCREALGTLFNEDYAEVCCDGILEAISLLEKRIEPNNEEAQQAAT